MTGNGQTSDVKAALLARWQEGPIEGGGLAIPRASRTTRVPLSLAQQRLWILEQLQPGDHQVKLRGYRVELGEIETHLDGWVTALCVSFGIELAVQDMFVDPTVEHLAAPGWQAQTPC